MYIQYSNQKAIIGLFFYKDISEISLPYMKKKNSGQELNWPLWKELLANYLGQMSPALNWNFGNISAVYSYYYVQIVNHFPLYMRLHIIVIKR